MDNPTNAEENKLLKLGANNDTSTKDAVTETVETLNAVGDLTRDAYIGVVRQTRFFVRFLHKQIKPF